MPAQTHACISKANSAHFKGECSKQCAFEKQTLFISYHARGSTRYSTQQHYAHRINNDVTHHVMHSSCQAPTTRKKFPIQASVESMSHVLDLDCDYTPTSTDLHLQWAIDGCPTQRQRSSPSSSTPKLTTIARLDDSTTASLSPTFGYGVSRRSGWNCPAYYTRLL